MARQCGAVPHRLIDLAPPPQPQHSRQRRQHRERQAEDVPGTGQRRLTDELDDRDGRGQQPQRRALPRQERAFVGQGEPIVGFLCQREAFFRSISASAAASSARWAAEVSQASLRFLTTLAGAPTAIE